MRRSRASSWLFFFFQAEDGIRDHCVTGVQTCALPISSCAIHRREVFVAAGHGRLGPRLEPHGLAEPQLAVELQPLDTEAAMLPQVEQIGRASCRERV